MRHVTLTCKNHPNLRWSCKSLAFSPGHGYNGARSIFFHGALSDAQEGAADPSLIAASIRHPDAPVHECPCPPSDLILAPEDEWSKLSIEEQRAAINAD